MQKRLLVPSRVRRVPRQFSWIDQRLVRDHHIARCDCTALALYLLLLTVADAQGLSYGITWSSRISETLSYSFGIDAKSYTFEDVVDSNPAAIPSDEFEETFISTTFSLFFLF